MDINLDKENISKAIGGLIVFAVLYMIFQIIRHLIKS